MFGVDVVDSNGKMAVTRTQIVRLFAIMIDRQLDLEISFLIAQIYQREAFEPKAIGNREAKRAVIKIDSSFFVEHADHSMDGFGHLAPPV
jgi:hypothetical protein